MHEAGKGVVSLPCTATVCRTIDVGERGVYNHHIMQGGGGNHPTITSAAVEVALSGKIIF